MRTWAKRGLHLASRAPGSLRLHLRVLEFVTPFALLDRHLASWADEHLNLAGRQQRRWRRDVGWGIMAEKLLFAHLARGRRDEALSLVQVVDDSAYTDARSQGGVLVATGHYGPNSFLVHYLLEREPSLAVWTQYEYSDDLRVDHPDAWIVDPRNDPARTLVRSALHVRGGGVLLGAPDADLSARHHCVEAHRTSWCCSPGMSALARRLDAPTFLALATWHGRRLHVTFAPFPRPDNSLPDAEWDTQWCEEYLGRLIRLVDESPRSLQFLWLTRDRQDHR